MKKLMIVMLLICSLANATEPTVLKSELQLQTWEGFDTSILGFSGEIAQKLYLGMEIPVYRDPNMTCNNQVMLVKVGKSITCYKCSEVEPDSNIENFKCFREIDIKTGKLK